MSAPLDRVLRREQDDAQPAALVVAAEPHNQHVKELTAMAADPHRSSTPDAHQQLASTSGVRPLSGHIKHVQKPLPGRSLHSLAVVELQLCLQFLDSKDKLIAARCSRGLVQAASAPFAWSAKATVTVTVRSDADAQRICTSLLRFAPVHLRCVCLESLQCVTAVPNLFGLELKHLPAAVTAADLTQLLQHPNVARLQTLRLGLRASELLTVDAMRLIAHLPKLRTFGLFAPTEPDGDSLLQPLTDAPALTDLHISWLLMKTVTAGLLSEIGGCAGLRRLSLRHLTFPHGTFVVLCSSPNLRWLQHLELADYVASDLIADVQPPVADEYGDACSSLEQLQSLTLDRSFGVNELLAHLHRSPALGRISIRCVPTLFDIGEANSTLPSRAVLAALLTAAPQLEVRLLLPATFDRWLALKQSSRVDREFRTMWEQQWHELQRMALELERVTVVDKEPPSD